MAEFDALTCAIDDAIDKFMATAKELDGIDVIEALRVVRQSRQDYVSEGIDWSVNELLDGRGTE